MTCYRLAHALHKTLADVLDMTEDEFMGWLAFFKIKGTEGNG